MVLTGLDWEAEGEEVEEEEAGEAPNSPTDSLASGVRPLNASGFGPSPPSSGISAPALSCHPPEAPAVV